jgi:membrane protease YdiL (CAAX protease family)
MRAAGRRHPPRPPAGNFGLPRNLFPSRGSMEREGRMSETEEAKPVASRRHLAILCGIVLAFAAIGFLASMRGEAPGVAATGLSGPALYLPMLAAEWGLFLYVRMGLRKQGVPVAALISARPLRGGAIALDLLVGVALAAAWLAAEWLLDATLGGGNRATFQPLLVRHAAEIPLWILLSLSAGFVEEFTFRGYFQRQFGALLGSPWLAIIAQALMFGVMHGYQGWISVLRIAVVGLIFGVTAFLRRSLVPSILVHAGIDIWVGLVAFR